MNNSSKELKLSESRVPLTPLKMQRIYKWLLEAEKQKKYALSTMNPKAYSHWEGISLGIEKAVRLICELDRDESGQRKEEERIVDIDKLIKEEDEEDLNKKRNWNGNPQTQNV